MEKWMYDCMMIQNNRGAAAQLSTFGDNGWELVSVVPASAAMDMVTAWFRKLKE
jgi:hypothetical protein